MARYCGEHTMLKRIAIISLGTAIVLAPLLRPWLRRVNRPVRPRAHSQRVAQGPDAAQERHG